MTTSGQATAPAQPIEHHPCSSAEEFLEILSPRDARWTRSGPWIYRGQANVDWRPQPKAIRNPKAFANYGILGDPSDFHKRQNMLDDLLRRFRDGLDASGIVAPVASTNFTKAGADVRFAGEPEPVDFPLMALAQHHGLPTILLDCSRQARVAAYFAATYALDPETKDLGSHLGVWALRVAYPEGTHEWERQLLVYTAPGSSNPNLRAQSGLFTVLRDVRDPDHEPFTPEEDVGRIPLEDYVQSMAKPAPGVLTLRRVMAPRSCAKHLLRLLAYEGIDGASMFPGADGVAESLRERALWDTE
jgi:hypothetical protein